jgi:hypothetical protein
MGSRPAWRRRRDKPRQRISQLCDRRGGYLPVRYEGSVRLGLLRPGGGAAISRAPARLRAADCRRSRADRCSLFARCAGVHVDFHAHRHFDDLRSFPGHSGLPTSLQVVWREIAPRLNLGRPPRQRKYGTAKLERVSEPILLSWTKRLLSWTNLLQKSLFNNPRRKTGAD